MGWANCGTDSKGRDIGYAFEATCDHPGCKEKIDRGLAYACGGMHGEYDRDGGYYACEGYFCSKHLFIGDSEMDPGHSIERCEKCHHAHVNKLEDWK